jgi:anthranilate synthase/aminodeoxychorismate synthase-like glutamine amidotransferase
MIPVLVLDNYDSFTYNLVAILRGFPGVEVSVRRNDEASNEDLERAEALVLSPGPGIPSEAGDLMPVLERCASRIPVLGVCLGHQAIGEHFGGRLLNLQEVYHGVATEMERCDQADPLFQGVDARFAAGRYHSWVLDPASLPPVLQATALDAQGQIMAMRHRSLPVWGLQFHPESVLTPCGPLLLENFIREARAHQSRLRRETETAS